MTKPLIIIRKASEEDFSEVLEVHKNSIREVASKDHNQAQVSAWSDHLKVDGFLNAKGNGEDFFVAVEGHKIIGFSSIKEDKIMAIYVAKIGIGKGVGVKLYYTLEKQAKKRGYSQLSLTSSLTARGFYKKLGFIETEEIAHRFKAGAVVRAFRTVKKIHL
ncbi:MAG: GNAT family N-acetyltransferase [Bacteriovoracaceae bacterium]